MMNFFKNSKKVLVADDEEDVRFYLKKYLERKRFRVVLAFDGEQAKRFIENESFDFFLLDCSMPNLTGLELIQIARSRNPVSKIVLISGFPAVNDSVIKELGGDCFINKPIKINELDGIFDDLKKERI